MSAWSEAFDKHRNALRSLNITPRDYLLRMALPMMAAGLILGAGILVAGGLFLSPWLRWPLGVILLGAGPALAYLYPIAQVDRRRSEIDEALPFFMTHFGVMSTSNIPRTQMIKVLSQNKEYKGLADELALIHSLVTDWNMALPEACRFLSKSTPSRIFGDFLERLAHAMETGQDLEIFLQSEQSVVMKEYATVYESQIYQMESWKDLYVSSVMSGAFFVLFAIITPILTGNSPESLLIGVLAFMLFMEVLLLLVLRLRLPSDRLLHNIQLDVKEKRTVQWAAAIALAVGAVLAVALVLVVNAPVGVAAAAGVAPMAVAGLLANQREERIKRREENYGAFVRSLGASLSARGGSPQEILSSVRHHNFGPLTGIVHALYARLTWRLDDAGAWKRFSAESGSHVVDAFTDMFTQGLRTGGKPDKIGDIISHNVVRVLNLRKSRYSTAGTFRGIMIGLTASMAFVMAAGVGVLGVLGDLFSTAAVDIDPEDAPVALDFSANVPLIENLILVLMVLHSLLGAFMLKMVDGGGFLAGLGMFAVMVVITVGLLAASAWLLPQVFSITG